MCWFSWSVQLGNSLTMTNECKEQLLHVRYNRVWLYGKKFVQSCWKNGIWNLRQWGMRSVEWSWAKMHEKRLSLSSDSNNALSRDWDLHILRNFAIFFPCTNVMKNTRKKVLKGQKKLKTWNQSLKANFVLWTQNQTRFFYLWFVILILILIVAEV